MYIKFRHIIFRYFHWSKIVFKEKGYYVSYWILYSIIIRFDRCVVGGGDSTISNV